MDELRGSQIANILFAALAAVAVQPVVLMARLAPDFISSPEPHYGIGFFLLAVMAVAGAVVLILGIPAFLLLRRFHLENFVSLGVAGLLVGALPFAFFWPSNINGYSAGQTWHGKYVETYLNGVPTIYAWLTYGEDLMFFALHGLAGAFAFYSVWRWQSRKYEPTQSATSGFQ